MKEPKVEVRQCSNCLWKEDCGNAEGFCDNYSPIDEEIHIETIKEEMVQTFELEHQGYMMCANNEYGDGDYIIEDDENDCYFD